MKGSAFSEGMRDGVAIAVAYFAVSFSLGMTARTAGLTAGEGFVCSLLTRASAGEYGSYSLMAAGAGVAELVGLCVVANLRYLLMGASLTQKFHPRQPLWKRVVTACCITDEIFGISIARPGYLPMGYPLGATLVAATCWAGGTACGIVAGNLLPAPLVSALSVMLYGMFLAIIVPPGRKDKAVGLAVAGSFACSGLCAYLPPLNHIGAGTRIVALTIAIAAAAAYLKPIDDETH